MGEDWQSIAAAAVVLATIAIFVRRAWKRRRSGAGGGCASAGACGCGVARPRRSKTAGARPAQRPGRTGARDADGADDADGD